MSTKGLMAHKKVAEVTLNEQGKAATLTLKEPWLFDGQRGPFTLKNVEHGHTITKNAYDERKGPKEPKPIAPKHDPVTRGVVHDPFGHREPQEPTQEPDYTPVHSEPLELPTKPFLPFKAVAQTDKHEIVFWFFSYRRQPIHDQMANARKALARLKGVLTARPQDYEVFVMEYLEQDELRRPSPFHQLRKELGTI